MTAAGNMPAGDRYADYRYTNGATPTAQAQSIPQSLPEQIGPAPAAPTMANPATMEEPARIVRLPIPYGIGAAAIEARPPVAVPAPIVTQPRPITFAPPALPGENAATPRYSAPSNAASPGAPPTSAATDTGSTDQTSLVLRISPP
ncbi:MAG: hypothetical protein K8T25_14835 [Planctomycetia bacterium]|nr:hypothetical protein [Planctomycetia bacterium]